MDRALGRGFRAVRRIVVAVVGSTILAIGVVLIVLPGPAFLVIPFGLAILALEFEWARGILRRARAMGASAGSEGSSPPREGRPPEK